MEKILEPLHTFKDQFSFSPQIINEENLVQRKSIVICGMGGSAISVSLLKLFFPELSVTLHNSYGLPHGLDKENTLIILNSYSGDTEEVLDSFSIAHSSGFPVAVLTRGGKLAIKAADALVPHVILPTINIEPRFSIGHQLLGLLSLMSEDQKASLLHNKITLVNMEHAEKSGKELAEKIHSKNIVLYSSTNLYPVTYLIKAAINEGAKVPCFVSVVPEANHNELQSYTTSDSVTTKDSFGFIMLTSPYDHVRIAKRLTTMNELYRDKGFISILASVDHTSIEEIFEAVLTGYFLATFLAIAKNVDPYGTPLIQEFKKKIIA